MFSRKTIFISLTVLLFAVGCGQKKDIVATVGKEVITTAQFKSAMAQRYRTEDNAKSAGLAQRRSFAEEMAMGLAKYQEGLSRGFDKRPEVLEETDKVIKRKALDLLYQKKVVDAVVTEAAVKKFYDMSGTELKACHILLKSGVADTTEATLNVLKARCDSIKQAIQKGLPFKVAAKMFSEDATSAADSGDIGWFQWGRMVDEFQEAAWKGEVNRITGPVKTPYGYHLILVEEKRPVQDRRPFEESKERIKSQMREVESQKMGDVAKEYVAKLRKENKVEYVEPGTTNFRNKMKDPNVSKAGLMNSFFNEAERAQVVATYKGGKVVIGDLVEKLGSNAGRVDWTQNQTSLDLINAIIEPKLLDENAKNMGLLKEAAKDSAVVEQKKAAVIRLLEKEEVTDKIKPTEAEERNYYQTHLDTYIQPEMRTIREIFIKKDSVKCERTRERALKGENFAKLALRFNEKESTQIDTGKIGPFEQKRFGLLGITAFQLQKLGEISGVVRLGDNFSVIQLLEIQPSRTKSFEESAAQVKRDYRTAKTDEMQNALEKLCLNKYKFTPNDEKLAAAWPLPKPEDEKQDKKVAREP